MPDREEITAAIVRVVKCSDGSGLGEDIVEYMVGLLEEETPGSPEELTELIGPFVTDAADVDEDIGRALCVELYQELWPAVAAVAAKPKSKKQPSKPLKQLTPVSMADFGADARELENANQTFGLPESRSGAYESAKDTLEGVARVAKKKKEKVARRVERRAWSAHDKSDDGSVWVDLSTGVSLAGDGAAAITTAHLRDFSLPNKKGSGDLLVDASCTLVGGRRYGLIGKNGVGKSTFLDALARRELPGVPPVSIFYVRQEVVGDERPALSWVMEADAEHQALIVEARGLEGQDSAEAGVRLARIYEQLEGKESSSEGSEKRAREILKGLGLDDEMVVKPTNSLSGGWRMRVAIACALFVSPGLLLLDEPTNHLDLETVVWLENHLREEFKQTLLVVSHDRNFLNEVVTDILHFEGGKLENYRGDYFSFDEVVTERRAQQERLHEVQEEKKAHMQKFITEHGQLGSNGPNDAKMRKSRMKKMERVGMEAAAAMEGRKIKSSYDGVQDEVEAVNDTKAFVLNFPDPGSTGRDIPVVRLDNVSFAYDQCPALFERASFSLDVRSRVAVLGRNGCGKSTLIKVIMDRLQPTAGVSTRDSGSRIEYIAQHHLDQLDGDSTPLAYALQKYPEDESFNHEQRMRNHLASFGLGGDVLPHQLIRTLSGGQKCRLSMAMTMYRRPHFLIMDEPTNHLDMETTDALVSAINSFKGGLLIVSHDQHLISQVCTELLVVRNRTVKRFEGTVETYKKRILKGSL